MEFLYGSATPDNVRVSRDENLIDCLYDTNCETMKDFPYPFVYGIDKDGNHKLWIGEIGSFHYELLKDEDVRISLIEGRFWLKLCIITMWQMDRKIVQKSIPDCLEQLEQIEGIDLSKFSLLYNTNNNLVKMISVYEYLGKEQPRNDATDTSKEREYHLMSPVEKQKLLQQDTQYKKNREEYFKTANKVWQQRHGNIDPAQYHLLMYQENKNSNKVRITESDIKQMVKECVKKIVNEAKNYDILYRGVGRGQDKNVPVLWLTTSKQYCGNYGNNVLKYAVNMDVLDSLANEKEALNYLINDTDEYPFYEAQNFNIEKMKKDGFSGYYYHEEEYKCLNVCLFNKGDAKLLNK